jgi:hypothetical protein
MVLVKLENACYNPPSRNEAPPSFPDHKWMAVREIIK